jgi:hypothetical protein
VTAGTGEPGLSHLHQVGGMPAERATCQNPWNITGI